MNTINAYHSCKEYYPWEETAKRLASEIRSDVAYIEAVGRNPVIAKLCQVYLEYGCMIDADADEAMDGMMDDPESLRSFAFDVKAVATYARQNVAMYLNDGSFRHWEGVEK